MKRFVGTGLERQLTLDSGVPTIGFKQLMMHRSYKNNNRVAFLFRFEINYIDKTGMYVFTV